MTECEIEECRYNHNLSGVLKCCFGGWNAGLGCFMDMDKGEFDSIVDTMVGSRTVNAAYEYSKRGG